MTAEPTTTNHSPQALRVANAPRCFKLLAGLLPFYVLANAFFAFPENWSIGVFVMVVMVLTFAMLPASSRSADTDGMPWYDWIAVALMIGLVGYYIFAYEDLNANIGGYDEWQHALMAVAVLLTVEAARRAVGIVVPLIALLLVAWAFWYGFPHSMILTRLYVGDSGMFGTLTDIFMRYVFLFFIFGALMERAGAASFLQRYINAVTGRTTAGAAKAAIFGSGVMGMLIGTSAGNVAVTGTLTIPMMRREGYTPPRAAAIETVAGLGGELSPPVMGSAAFVLVAYTATTYQQVALISILPAILYYLPIYLMVHFEGIRDNRRADVQSSGETAWQLVRAYYHLAAAPIVLVVLIGMGFSPTYAAAGGVITVAVLSQIQRTERLSLADLWRALVDGTISFLSLGATAPILGTILVIVLLIGLPTTMTTVAVNFASGALFLVAFGVFLLALVLGMGMPIVAAYMILSTVAAPTLTTFGVPLLAAHLFIFWYAQTGALTPPVALATQIASAIAGCSMWKTAWEAIKLSVGLFATPLGFIYGSLLSPDIGVRLWAFVSTGTGLALWAAFTIGFVRRPLTLVEKIILPVLIAAIVAPPQPFDIAGVVFGMGFLGWLYFFAGGQHNAVPSEAR